MYGNDDVWGYFSKLLRYQSVSLQFVPFIDHHLELFANELSHSAGSYALILRSGFVLSSSIIIWMYSVSRCVFKAVTIWAEELLNLVQISILNMFSRLPVLLSRRRTPDNMSASAKASVTTLKMSFSQIVCKNVRLDLKSILNCPPFLLTGSSHSG